MDTFVIEGGKALRGQITISGSKNAVLPIMAAALLTDEVCILENVPDLRDVHTMCRLLSHLGAQTHFSKNKLVIDPKKVRRSEASYHLVRTMRASVLVMGPLLARFGRARVSLPGGCAIGARPIDIHLKGFEQMGATHTLNEGYIEIIAGRPAKNVVMLSFPSVGATENLLMYAAAQPRRTVLRNVAREPEIADLASFLQAMGAEIKGAGTGRIEVHGVSKLRGVKHNVVADRVEAGTFAVAAALTRGDLRLVNARADHMKAVLDKLTEAGAKVEPESDGVRVSSKHRPQSITLTTMPYPGFPTDMQAQFMALASVGDGTSVITETVFENRYMHTAELQRLGADISLDGRVAVIRGVKHLKGAQLTASDLRASAALVLAALAADGRSIINRVYHLDRGYECMEKKLRRVGASIRRSKTS